MIKIYLSDILGKKKMKQADLRRLTGIRSETMSAYYYEYVKRINVADLNKICKALNCKLSDLMEYIPDDE